MENDGKRNKYLDLQYLSSQDEEEGPGRDNGGVDSSKSRSRVSINIRGRKVNHDTLD